MLLDPRKSLFVLPNLFTLSSVLCGFYAILVSANPAATSDDFYRASMLIVFAMFFDTIDGRVARLTRTQSALGVQLDSLADVVSFGVAPAVLVYRWGLDELGTVGVLGAFAYIACGTIRLARFNVLAMESSGQPKKPGKYILGLPIPGAAAVLVSMVVAYHAAGRLPAGPYVLLAVVAALALLMVSTFRFRSFKDLRLNWRTVVFVGAAIGGTLVVARFASLAFAFMWLLTSYIVIGVFETFVGLARRRGEADDDDPAGESAGAPQQRAEA
ncbi:MAG: CDP-diacylglycerol--serine O-phosphatidyltransferase [Myxococcota bacterium]